VVSVGRLRTALYGHLWTAQQSCTATFLFCDNHGDGPNMSQNQGVTESRYHCVQLVLLVTATNVTEPHCSRIECHKIELSLYVLRDVGN
jgi:hypothetical protein